MGTYIALDVETANPNLSSVCQIGMAKFKDGECIEKFETLVNPESFFDSFNVYIHGIGEVDVSSSPKFPEIYSSLVDFLSDEIIVSHSNFDKSALSQVCKKYDLPFPNNEWLDSTKVARRVWDFCRDKGYGLRKLCKKFKIPLKHHNAYSDAHATGLLINKAMSDSGMTIDELMERTRKPLLYNTSLQLAPNPDGHLIGEGIVFTGTLSITRSEAESLAVQSGCQIHKTVRADTTILVVGDIDLSKLAGFEKSSKQRKAEEMISKGNDIRIISETDFNDLIFNGA